MSRIIPDRYLNPHAIVGVRARIGPRKLDRFVGEPCPYCGTAMRVPTRDHKIPKSRKSHPHYFLWLRRSVDRINIHVVCLRCNNDKGGLDHEEYLAVLQGLASRLDRGRAYREAMASAYISAG